MVILLTTFIVLVIGFFSLFQLRKRKVQLSLRILLSLVIGVCIGCLLRNTPDSIYTQALRGALDLLGSGYLALLKMLVVPLILTSIIHAILNLGSSNGKTIKKISFMTCSLLLGLTAIASLIGVLVGEWFNVGKNMTMPAVTELPKHPYTGLVSTILNMLPQNPVASMAQENTVAVVLFAVLLGMAARMLDQADHDKMETFRRAIASLFAIVKKLALMVLGLTPYGILALIALLVADQGIALLAGILNFIAAMYTAMFVVVSLHTLILSAIGEVPLNYFKKAATALFVAFTTRSSFGTLPVTEEVLRDKFQTSQVIASFVPSIGATIGMNACAGIFPAMLVVMTMNMLHQPLTFNLILMIMFINAIASLGISGIPGTAYIAATVTLTSLNLPYAVVALVQGVDPLVDMGRTAVNVNGVITTALVTNRLSNPKERIISTLSEEKLFE